MLGRVELVYRLKVDLRIREAVRVGEVGKWVGRVRRMLERKGEVRFRMVCIFILKI